MLKRSLHKHYLCGCHSWKILRQARDSFLYLALITPIYLVSIDSIPPGDLADSTLGNKEMLTWFSASLHGEL